MQGRPFESPLREYARLALATRSRRQPRIYCHNPLIRAKMAN